MIDGPDRSEELVESSNALGIESVSAFVENDADTILFFPEAGIEEAIAANVLQPCDQFPQRPGKLDDRVEADDPILSVTVEYEKSGFLRSSAVETTHRYDLRYVQTAVEHVGAVGPTDAWVPTSDPFPTVLRFPRSPPELVDLDKRGAVESPETVGRAELREPCGCAIPPRIEL